MLDPKQIKTWIAAGLPCEHLAIDGDGQHFAALIVSGEFAGMSRVKRQQRVYQVIKEQLNILGNSLPISPSVFEHIDMLRGKAGTSTDYIEGIRSFYEKRKPIFIGE